MGRRASVLAAACAAALLVVAPVSAHGGGMLRHTFVWPATGTITTPFGYGSEGFHPGIDIGLLRSLDVRAAVPGVVSAVGYTTGFEGYGNIVLVDAGSGLQTLYAHLATVHARIGESVVAGELLGIAGCTGSCTGTHLHFEVRLDGRAVDPLQFLPGGVPAAPPGPDSALRLEVVQAAHAMFADLPELDLDGWWAPGAGAAPSPRVDRLLAGRPRPFP